MEGFVGGIGFIAGRRRSIRLQNKPPINSFSNTPDNPIDVECETIEAHRSEYRTQTPVRSSSADTEDSRMADSSDTSEDHQQPINISSSRKRETSKNMGKSKIEGCSKEAKVVSSDSDFCDQPKVKRQKDINLGGIPATTQADNNKKSKHALRTRTSPKVLFTTIKDLSDAQKQAVKDIGMGCLLGMKLDGVPQRIGYHVVDNLNTNTMCIGLETGNIKITEQSIHEILGLPVDGIDIESFQPPTGSTDLLQIWKTQFDKQRISPSDVQDRIKQMRDSGTMFKLNFLMIVVSVLAECTRVGECKPKILSNLSGVDMIPKVNWSKYIYSCIRQSKTGWRRDIKDSYYAGPLTYLTLLYVESTKADGFSIDDKVAPLQRWSMELLRIRQDVHNHIGGLAYAPIKNAEPTSNTNDAGPSTNVDPIFRKKVLVKKFDQKILEFTTDRCELEVELLKALGEFPEDPNFKRQTLEFAGIFKNSSWESEADKYRDAQTHSNDEMTPLTNRPLVICLGSSGETQRQTSTTLVSQTSNSKAMVISAENATPLNVTSPATHDEYKEIQPISTHYNMGNKGKGKATTSETTDIKERNVAEFGIPSFDLGISPDKKHVKQEEVDDKHRNPIPRMKKPSSKLRSPYVQRSVSLVPTNDEKQLQDWMIRSSGATHEAIFTSLLNKTVNRNHMRMLADQQKIPREVIDGWCDVLNEEENYRAPDSPARYFFCTEVALDWNQTGPHLTPEATYDSYREMMDYSVGNNVDVLSMRETDLVFFPVVNESRYYVVVFNLKNPAIVILDSEDIKGDEGNQYTNQVHALVSMMSIHLTREKHPSAAQIGRCKPRKATLRWQCKEKKPEHGGIENIDKGVILMRNMETYMGQEDGKWESGLYKDSPKQKKQLKDLRTKYVMKMLNSKTNKLHELIPAKVLNFMSMEASLRNNKYRGY